jgi:plastocyanin
MTMKGYDRRRAFATFALTAALFAVGCSNDKTAPVGADAGKAEPSKTEEASTGKTIIVEASSDADGNYFRPANIEAHPGDIIRFTLKAGVHNVNFLADSNPGKTGLPAPSEMLQLPGQTYDVKVTFAKGHYYFQCDPHALLGMKGHLEVED